MDEKLSEEDITFVLKTAETLEGTLARLEEYVRDLTPPEKSIKYQDVRGGIRGAEEAYKTARIRYIKRNLDRLDIDQYDKRYSRVIQDLKVLELRDEPKQSV